MTVYLAITSGRSGKKVMRRKPSASHCVKKLWFDTYRPDKDVLSCGANMVSISSSTSSGAFGMVSMPAVSLYCDGFSTLPFRRTITSSICSPCNSMLRLVLAGLWRMRIRLATTVRAGSRSKPSSTLSTRKLGGV
ncbi:hypothetical protein D3C72_2074100 [compost metagenome]